MNIKESKFREIIKKEILKTLNEISSYDRHLIPKEKPWSDEEIIEFLNEKKSISEIINLISYKPNRKVGYDELIKYTKIGLLDIIIKYKLNKKNETPEFLDTLDINSLEDFLVNLIPSAEAEYEEIKYEFVDVLVNEDILDKNTFYSIS